jgi:hypothetical protein
MLLACCAGAAGCRFLGKSGPLSDEIAACRQLSQRGKSAMDRDDWSAAEAYFVEAIRAHPDDAAARRYYAGCCGIAGRNNRRSRRRKRPCGWPATIRQAPFSSEK